MAITNKAKTKSKIYQALRVAIQLVLNCKRFSYFQPFTRDIITKITNHSNIIFIGAIQQVRHLKKATKRTKGKPEESNKK